MDNNYKFVSLNVRGINNNLKRRRIFRYLKSFKPDVCLLQETYATKDKEFLWQSEWGNKCIFSNGGSNNCGVAVLFSKRLANKVVEIMRDINGRQLFIKLKIGEYTYCLANLYAPNNDDPNFLQSVFDQIDEMDAIFNIVGGDFNVVRDAKIDRNVDRIYHPRCKRVIDGMIQGEKFTDIWRVFNPEKRFFTHMRRDRNSWARLDYFLVSTTLQTKCTKAEIIPSVCSDHSLITLEIGSEEPKRGPGIWKFNNKLLNDDNFVSELRSVVKECKESFQYLSPTELWDLIKFEIMQFSKQFSKQKAFEVRNYKFELYAKLSRMQEELILDNDTPSDLMGNIQKSVMIFLLLK